MSNILSSDFCNYEAVPADLAYSGKEADGDPYFDTEEAAFDLDAVAPDGCYFGALEGDGAALGFWEVTDGGPF